MNVEKSRTSASTSDKDYRLSSHVTGALQFGSRCNSWKTPVDSNGGGSYRTMGAIMLSEETKEADTYQESKRHLDFQADCA